MGEVCKSSQVWNDEYEKDVINTLQAISNGETIEKNRQFYHIKSTYKLMDFAGITKVCRIKDNKIMITKTNAWNVIRDLHTACGHKGEKKSYKKVAEHYANIPMTMIKQFIEQCERCAEK